MARNTFLTSEALRCPNTDLDCVLKSLFERYGVELPVPSYKVYTALLTQSGTSVPTVVINENTLGTAVLQYNTVGTYRIVITGAFLDTDKVNVFIGSNVALGYTAIYSIIDANTLEIKTVKFTDNSTANGKLTKTPIRIEVYN